EAIAGGVILWRFAASRQDSAPAEQRAQKLIGLSYFLLACYVTAEAVHPFLATEQPGGSWVGVGLAAVTALTMPVLATAKRRVGRALGSSATVSEAQQNQLCAYLSVALLLGLLANALAGWWWADPAAALVIAALAVYEGSASWRGEACDCC